MRTRNRFDFVRFLSDFNLPRLAEGHHHCNRGWIQTHCPFCAGGSHGWHLGLSLSSAACHCWRCGAIPIAKVLAKLVTADLGQLFEKYGDRSSEELREFARFATKIEYPPDMRPLLREHREYLLSRDFDPDLLAEEWQLSGTGGLAGVWSWRIIIPICDSDGSVIAYSGRAIKDEVAPRYLTLERERSITNPKSLLYGEHRIDGDMIVVVEGPADVWRLGPGSAATLGTGWTVEQAIAVSKYRRRIIMFDNELPAQRKAIELADWLGGYPGETEVVDGLKTDPGDMSAEEVAEFWLSLR